MGSISFVDARHMQTSAADMMLHPSAVYPIMESRYRGQFGHFLLEIMNHREMLIHTRIVKKGRNICFTNFFQRITPPSSVKGGRVTLQQVQ